MTAYYNEIDPYAAQWLRNLINAGHIAPGIVDERSIEDVYPSDLRGFTQCHFFAGIGVWSHALRSAGWSDDRPVWTGSCPCQPFSAAGQGAGFDDERHLWPHFHHLIKECGPAIVLGEQVASKDADAWIDLVQADVEALGNAFGAVPFPSASIGAPHIRDRLYWVAYAHSGPSGQGGENVRRRIVGSDAQPWAGLGGGRVSDGLAHAELQQRPERKRGISNVDDAAGRLQDTAAFAGFCRDSGLANNDGNGREPRREGCEAMGHGQATGSDRGPGGLADTTSGQHIASGAWADQRAMAGGNGAMQAAHGPTGPINGFWADADWLFCRDGKWRPVEPGSFPLVDGAPARVGRLRAYGNAINAKAAQVFIECVMDSIA